MQAMQLVFHLHSHPSLAGESSFCPETLVLSVDEIFAAADIIQSFFKCETLKNAFQWFFATIAQSSLGKKVSFVTIGCTVDSRGLAR